MTKFLASEAEQAVLGAVFLEPSIFPELRLKPEYFYTEFHQEVFQVMQDLHEKEYPIDILTVFDKLPNPQDLPYLTELSGKMPTAQNVSFYARFIKEAYFNRKKHTIAKNYTDKPNEETEQRLREVLLTAEEEEKDQRDFMDLGQKFIERVYEEQHAYDDYMSTGFEVLDRVLDGLRLEELVIIGARPSVGKTAFAINLAYNIANSDMGVATLFSCEMSKEQIMNRTLSTMMGVNVSVWKDPYSRLNLKDKDRALRSFTHLNELAFHVVDKASPTVLDIEAEIIRNQKEYPDANQAIFIDYLGLMGSTGKYERKDLEIASITKGLKQLARKYRVCIVLLAQLSRSVEQRQDKRPMLSDLRDSGSIEQDADKIAFLYREDYYDRASQSNGAIEIIVAKNRNGSIGTVKLDFIKEYNKFAVPLLRKMENTAH